MEAFDEVGGQAYLVRVAQEDPRTFCGLLAKVLPLQVSDSSGEPIVLMWKGEEKILEYRRKREEERQKLRSSWPMPEIIALKITIGCNDDALQTRRVRQRGGQAQG